MMRARGFWAGFIAALLLLGAVDWHPAGERPDSLVPAAGEIYFPGATHPDQPVHLEAAHAAERPHCPVCLHHLQTSGAHLRVSVLVAPPAATASAAPAPNRVNASGSSRSSGARGPPSFS